MILSRYVLTQISNLHITAKISEFNHETFHQPIGLSENRDALESTFVGCFEAGWSQQDQHATLQKSELVLIDTEQCQEQADDGDEVYSFFNYLETWPFVLNLQNLLF